MTDIVERLEFDATRCELQFSKGVAGNITEAIAEITRLRAASEWRDISTAPRDNSSILFYEQSGLGVFAGYWCETTDNWAALAASPNWDVAPTHWRPLPAPPQRNEVTK